MRFLILLLLASLGGCSVRVSGDAAKVFGVALIGVSAYSYHAGGAPESARPPELAADRTVNEVDCSQPFDPSAGNIRCK